MGITKRTFGIRSHIHTYVLRSTLYYLISVTGQVTEKGNRNMAAKVPDKRPQEGQQEQRKRGEKMFSGHLVYLFSAL